MRQLIHHEPQLVLYLGAMASGKSTRLVLDLDRFVRQGKSVAAFKPSIDDRYFAVDIATHSGDRFPAVAIESTADMFAHLASMDEPANIVGVDELFMLKGMGSALVWLFRNGVTVVAASLDLSYTCKPFDEVQDVVPFATRIEKLAAVCDQCGADARFTHKKLTDDTDTEIRVGGFEMYAPRCMSHHPLMSDDAKP